MLVDLVVENLGVIEHAEVTFPPGSSAVTGETGAGKTLVVAAVGLLLGDRAEKILVRQGADRARVQGRFVLTPDHPAVALLRERDLLEEDGDHVELVLGRIVPREGSATARVNGRLATAATLNDLGPLLVEIAGQHEHGRVADLAWQRATLDAFAGAEALATEVSEHHRAARRARRRHEELLSTERARQRELDVVGFEIDEIEKAGLVADEELRLIEDVRRLEHAEAIGQGLSAAVEALSGEGAAQERIASAAGEVARLTSADPDLAALAERLEHAQVEVSDVASELARRITAPDPAALDATRDRLGQLARLKRKYGDSVPEVLRYLESARAKRDELTSADEEVDRWAAEAAKHEADARAASNRLSAARAEAAPRLQSAVESLLEGLALGGARFEVDLEPRELYEGGLESVAFAVAANPGEAPRPIAKVASGGELSRISLALHLVAGTAGATTMIFDEVDAGVGGSAAQSVGRSLAELARTSDRQVLVVTHLPQVAAFADAHFRVVKLAVGERAHAQLERIAGEERVAELSRMLAGLPASERAQEHALELLDLAAGAVG